MIRVVLVDDEPVILRSLKNQIESTDSDFTVIGKASNGEQGWKIVSELEPDLLFADISMPIMNGLEMIDRIRQEGLTTLTVILSGFSEFGKAQKAMELGVIEYLVKPIDPRSFPSFLARMKERILKIRRSALDRVIREAIYADSGYIRQHKLFLDKKFYLAKICFGSYRLQRLAGQERTAFHKEIDRISRTLSGLIHGKVMFWVVRDLVPNELLIIIEADQPGLSSLYQQVFRTVNAQLKEQKTFTFCWSGIPAGLLEFQKGFSRLDQGIVESALFAESSLICAEAERVEPGQQDPKIVELIDNLGALPSSASTRARMDIIREILEYFRDRKKTQQEIYRVVRKILSAIDRNHVIQDHTILIDRAFAEAQTIPALIREMNDLIGVFGQQALKKEPNSVEAQILAVKDYIDNHFKQSLRIATLADQFGFSSSYLSIMFKKHIGSSPNDYITERRMQHACWLLAVDPDLEIREVAASAGYDDAYYFTRVFKSHIGCTPSEYKTRDIP